MELTQAQIQADREAALVDLASAYLRRDFSDFEAAVRPDMRLTLAGSSRLAGTYHGYDTFGRYLEVLRQVLRSAGMPITFTHRENVMVFRQVMVVMGPEHQEGFLRALADRTTLPLAHADLRYGTDEDDEDDEWPYESEQDEPAVTRKLEWEVQEQGARPTGLLFYGSSPVLSTAGQLRVEAVRDLIEWSRTTDVTHAPIERR